MLTLEIPEQRKIRNSTNEIISVKKTKLQLEHSLIAVRKWESKWHKPFLGNKEKTNEEIMNYISCMTVNANQVDPIVYQFLSQDDILKIVQYIEDPMTATWFSNNLHIGASNRSGEVVTAEIIYYWMIALNIPVEFEKWHLRQLLTLIKVVSIKNGGETKMTPQEAAKFRDELNNQRRAMYNSKG